jgi:hypothetical protein
MSGEPRRGHQQAKYSKAGSVTHILKIPYDNIKGLKM